MIYVGIDIAKLNLFTSAISSDGEILMDVRGKVILQCKRQIARLSLN